MSAELQFLNKLQREIADRIEQVTVGTSPDGGGLTASFSSSQQAPQRFYFEVDSNGTFKYRPPDSWGYNSDSPIRVESNKEFTIRATPMPGNPLNVNPWGDLRRAQRSNGSWYVEVNPQGAAYAASAGVRDKVYQEQGYLAKYNLEIEVPSNGGSYKAIKNGVYHC
jgi:hypothetical protein